MGGFLHKEEDRVTKTKQRKENQTGIPHAMKEKIERMSGESFDDVRVHYHSGKPAQLQAYAYTQGSSVYIGPGQERYLGHELGHVVQQKQGRVRADGSVNGIAVNSSPALEWEADKIAGMNASFTGRRGAARSGAAFPVQRKLIGITGAPSPRGLVEAQLHISGLPESEMNLTGISEAM